MSNKSEKQHLSHLKQLDDVLNYTSSKGNSITDREKHFREISKGSWEVIPNSNDKYNLAYEFLVSENFITKTSDGYRMNYSGLLSLGPNSFENSYIRENRKDDLSKFFWRWMPIIGVLSLLLSITVLANSFLKWW